MDALWDKPNSQFKEFILSGAELPGDHGDCWGQRNTNRCDKQWSPLKLSVELLPADGHRSVSQLFTFFFNF